MREAKGHEDEGILVRDEYAALRSGQIDIPGEQAFVNGCDRLVWQFPMSWYSCRPLLKEWEDPVLTYGWAYGTRGDALKSKELMLPSRSALPERTIIMRVNSAIRWTSS